MAIVKDQTVFEWDENKIYKKKKNKKKNKKIKKNKIIYGIFHIVRCNYLRGTYVRFVQKIDVFLQCPWSNLTEFVHQNIFHAEAPFQLDSTAQMHNEY